MSNKITPNKLRKCTYQGLQARYIEAYGGGYEIRILFSGIPLEGHEFSFAHTTDWGFDPHKDKDAEITFWVENLKEIIAREESMETKYIERLRWRLDTVEADIDKLSAEEKQIKKELQS